MILETINKTVFVFRLKIIICLLSFRSLKSYVEEIDFSLLSVHMSSQESNVINGIFNEYHLTYFLSHKALNFKIEVY